MTVTAAEPTADLAQAKRDLDERGYCIINNAVDAAHMGAMRERIWASALAAQSDGRFDAATRPVQGVGSLLNLHESFVQLAQHDVALELVGHLLGEDFLLSSLNGKIALPRPAGDAPSIHVHHDQGYVPLPMPPYPVAAALMWCGTDFSIENGGTLLVPGSHNENRWPGPGDSESAISVVAPAGSFALWDSRSWHATGHNASDEPRIGILAYYCRPWIRQQVNQLLDVEPHVLAGASDRLKVLLGLKIHLTLGNIPAKPGRPVNLH